MEKMDSWRLVVLWEIVIDAVRRLQVEHDRPFAQLGLLQIRHDPRDCSALLLPLLHLTELRHTTGQVAAHVDALSTQMLQPAV